MKKTLLASLFSVTLLLGGCASAPKDFAAIEAEGVRLVNLSAEENYKPSTIPEIEEARLIVNTIFLTTKPAYDTYIKTLQGTPEAHQYYAALERAKDDAERELVRNSLTEEQKKIISDFENSSVLLSAIEGLADAGQKAQSAINEFNADGGKNLNESLAKMVTGDFTLLLEEKEKLSLTFDQISHISDTVVDAYNSYQTMQQFKVAE